MFQHIKEKYQEKVISAMREKFGYKNKMAVPKIEKVVVNTGFGRLMAGKTGKEQEKAYSTILDDLALIVGQRPVLTRAKKAISSFKLREGMPVGAKVTLRGEKMYSFLDRLINIAIPRTRDFRGINPKSVDPCGSLTIAIKEHIIFPEVSAEKAQTIFGFEVTIATTAKNKAEGMELLKLTGFPFSVGE